MKGWLEWFLFFSLLACKVFTKQTDLRKGEKEESWRKLHRREVGQGAMMIFHSTRCSDSLCNPLKGLFIVQTHLHSLSFLSSSRELIPMSFRFNSSLFTIFSFYDFIFKLDVGDSFITI